MRVPVRGCWYNCPTTPFCVVTGSCAIRHEVVDDAKTADVLSRVLVLDRPAERIRCGRVTDLRTVEDADKLRRDLQRDAFFNSKIPAEVQVGGPAGNLCNTASWSGAESAIDPIGPSLRVQHLVVIRAGAAAVRRRRPQGAVDAARCHLAAAWPSATGASKDGASPNYWTEGIYIQE